MSERVIYRTQNGIRIVPYTIGQCIDLEKKCSYYDKVYHKRIYTTGFPIDDEDMFITYKIRKSLLRSWFPDYRIEDVAPDHRRPTFYSKLVPGVKLKDNQQEVMNKFALSDNPEIYLNVPTAFGKTFMGVVYATKRKARCMIVCNSNKILDQWKDTICNITTPGESKILRIKGSEMLEKVRDDEIDVFKYEYFLVTPRTLMGFASSHSFKELGKILDKLCIGLRIVDEAHLQLACTVKINAITNTPQVLCLSADATRGNTNAKRSFMDVFSKAVFITLDDEEMEKLKHVVAIFTTYDSNPDGATLHNVQGGPYNWSHLKYSRYEWRINATQSKVKLLLNEILTKTNFEPYYKTLILLQEIDHVDELTNELRSMYGDKISVGRYHSKVSPEEKLETLKSDIIVSCYGSFAVGVDVVNPEIRYVISTIPVDEVTSNQSAGRCRPIEGKTSFVWFLYDTGFTYCKNKMDKVSKYLTHSKIKDMFVRDLGPISKLNNK